MSDGAQTTHRSRLILLDVLRGIAVIAMVLYHAAFDLVYFGRLEADVNHDPVWLSARAMILSSFLFISGLSLRLAATRKPYLRRAIRRTLILAAAAALVSAATWLVFPDEYVFFGVLHLLALSSMLSIPFLTLGWANAVAGVAVVAAGHIFESRVFDSNWLRFIGFGTFKPITVDYVPIFPWFGVVLIGLAVGGWVARLDPQDIWPGDQSGALIRAMSWMGRHSLLIYLLHQPVLLGVGFVLFASTR